MYLYVHPRQETAHSCFHGVVREQHERATVLHFKMAIIRFESDHQSVITATLPNNRRPDRSLHIIFNSNKTTLEMNTHQK